MLNERFLLDDFEMRGEHEDEFEEIIKEIDAHTSHLKRSAKSFVVISIKEEQEQVDQTVMKAWYLAPNNPCGRGAIPVCNVPKSELLNGKLQALAEETLSVNRTMLLDTESGTIFFLSDMATNTMAQRINVTGEAIREHSLERDLFITRKMAADFASTLIVKQYRQVGKIFAMMSDNYVAIPLHQICVLYKDFAGDAKLGELVCEGWDITHERSRIAFSFPQYADNLNRQYQLRRPLVPCVELKTSDIGESSFMIRGYWKTTEGSIIYDKAVSRQHRGKVNVDQIERDVRRYIFEKYHELPERLSQLMTIDITPPGLDLKGNRGSGRNHKAVLEAFHAVLKQLELVKVLGKKRLMLLERYIDWNLIQDEMHYTAYDIVMDIFSLSHTIKAFFDKEEIGSETRRKLNEAVSRAADVNVMKQTGLGEQRT